MNGHYTWIEFLSVAVVLACGAGAHSRPFPDFRNVLFHHPAERYDDFSFIHQVLLRKLSASVEGNKQRAHDHLLDFRTAEPKGCVR